MRTTVDLDEDVLAAVRSLARAEGRSLGRVLSELARRGMAPVATLEKGPGGFPTFAPPLPAAPLTTEAVNAALHEET